ncbi:glycosyltransferase family 2 protein [uncultured Alistipes sp.]|uniref:glycosyltransferase family 2 protein n=1 Tax=uncultured Alistipes sp. TaxID=538949 RepID=UPI0025CF4140|nr:glycosyltransferase family 2 protein [uncultured Alistipes sp.]
MRKNDLTLAICLYNAEKYIEQTLQCIVGQTCQDFDLLVVDDCSTDNSVAVVESFFARNPRPYRMIRRPVNEGLCAARHLVEQTAAGRYVMFVDSDDCPYPALVEKLYRKITSDPDLMAVGCYLEYMDGAGKAIGGGIFMGETTKEGFYEKARRKKLIFMQPTAVYDLQAALSVGGHRLEGFPPGRPRYRDLCEDLDLWTRMSDLYVNGKAIVVVPEILCRYRKHGNALSSNTVGMMLRMRHIKQNLLRRRAGRPELSFVDFQASLSARELSRIERQAKAAVSLKQGVLCLHDRSWLKGAGLILRSVWYKPSYLWQKIKSSSGLFK